jgi:hypothetical protein
LSIFDFLSAVRYNSPYMTRERTPNPTDLLAALRDTSGYVDFARVVVARKMGRVELSAIGAELDQIFRKDLVMCARQGIVESVPSGTLNCVPRPNLFDVSVAAVFRALDQLKIMVPLTEIPHVQRVEAVMAAFTRRALREIRMTSRNAQYMNPGIVLAEDMLDEASDARMGLLLGISAPELRRSLVDPHVAEMKDSAAIRQREDSMPKAGRNIQIGEQMVATAHEGFSMTQSPRDSLYYWIARAQAFDIPLNDHEVVLLHAIAQTTNARHTLHQTIEANKLSPALDQPSSEALIAGMSDLNALHTWGRARTGIVTAK